ncbi:MAG: DUF3489 domain-containing protein [Alphaproteobacteria bacterium]|nr:DUF3489 domain-containing protein [Alphaproteobacteria bacterium]
MKNAAKSGATSSRQRIQIADRKPLSQRLIISNRPGGKLGQIVDRLATKSGATADELVEVTGWRRNSVLGALSRLKARGFDFHLDAHASRKAYRLSTRKG